MELEVLCFLLSLYNVQNPVACVIAVLSFGCDIGRCEVVLQVLTIHHEATLKGNLWIDLTECLN